MIITRKEAKARGIKRYFTGKPCKHGHISHRQVSNGVCVECFNIISRGHRQRYPEKMRERNREYVKANPEWKKKKDRLDFQKHKVVRLAKYKEYKANNREAVSAGKRNYAARKRGAAGSSTAKEIKAIYAAQRGKCAYCKLKLAKKYHVDHIMPLSLGGSNYAKNLQILCVSCNLQKRAKHPVDYAKELGMLV